MDETYLKIKGKNAYLYRAVDSNGNTIDFYVSEKRDKNAASQFFKKSVEAPHNQQPRVITTDKYGAEAMGSGTRTAKSIILDLRSSKMNVCRIRI